MTRRLTTALLAIASLGTVQTLDAQTFEGVVRQRVIEVGLEALEDRGFDASEALFDVPLDELVARLGSAMTVTEEEILIKGPLLRMDTSDEDGSGYVTVDFRSGVVRMVREGEGMYMEITEADLANMAGPAGGFDDGADEVPDVVETGLSRTINGMRATAFDVVSYDGTSRVWLSSDDPELMASFQLLAERASILSMGDAPDPTMAVAEHGIPVLVQTLEYDLYRIEEVLAVERGSVPDDGFAPPAGLQRVTLQDVMGGGMPSGSVAAGRATSGTSGAESEAAGIGVLAGLLGAGESPPAWIEYEVSGSLDASGREEDVVLCSETDSGFQSRSLGDVIVGLEADGNGEGSHGAAVTVDGPAGRFKGRGSIVVRSVGRDPLGLPIYEVEFEGSDLESRDGGVVHVRGDLSCSAM